MALCKIITNKLIPALLKVWKKSLYLILACSLMVHQYLYLVLRLGQASGVWGELLKELLVPSTQSVSVSECAVEGQYLFVFLKNILLGTIN